MLKEFITFLISECQIEGKGLELVAEDLIMEEL